MRFKDKVAIVTASAGAGIGSACIDAFAKEGANVVISDIHEKRVMASVEKVSEQYGVEALGVVCDVSNSSQVNDMVAKTIDKFGRVDILVNNAGREILGQCQDLTDEQWRLVTSVCIDGTFFTTRAVLPHMQKQNYGRLVHISSVAGFISANYGESHYCASKAAIMAFSRTVASENGKADITSNVVAPGLIMNEFLKKIYPAEFFTGLVAACPKGRAGRPEEIAHAVLFLSQAESAFITGDIITVSGGIYMHS